MRRPLGLLGFDRLLREEGLALLGLGLAKAARVGPRRMNIGELAARLERRGEAIAVRGGIQLLRW